MESPSSSVLGAIASPSQAAVIMPKEVIDSATKQGVKEYIGTGPYQLIEWKQDQYIRLQKHAELGAEATQEDVAIWKTFSDMVQMGMWMK